MSHSAHCNFVSPAQTGRGSKTVSGHCAKLKIYSAVEWKKYLHCLSRRRSRLGPLVVWWLDWFYNQIALYSDQWPCAHICLFRSKTQLPQRLQTSEWRDEYVWADSCKGTLRCFSKSAYLIFYRYCECKYPMYLMFTFALTWSKYSYYQSVSLSASDLVHHNGCPAMFYILIQILTRLVTVIQCCCTDRVSCCGLGLTMSVLQFLSLRFALLMDLCIFSLVIFLLLHSREDQYINYLQIWRNKKCIEYRRHVPWNNT